MGKIPRFVSDHFLQTRQERIRTFFQSGMRTLYYIKHAQWPHGLPETYRKVANKINSFKFDHFFHDFPIFFKNLSFSNIPDPICIPFNYFFIFLIHLSFLLKTKMFARRFIQKGYHFFFPDFAKFVRNKDSALRMRWKLQGICLLGLFQSRF